MAWEVSPGGLKYYTRSKKKHGRVIREYIGTGPAAEFAAAEDQARQGRRRQLREEEARLAELDAAVDLVCEAIDQLVHASLYHAGYYRQCSGPWRKRGKWHV